MLSKVETCSETLCRSRAGLPVRTTVMALLGVLGVEGSLVLENKLVCKVVQIHKQRILLMIFFIFFLFTQSTFALCMLELQCKAPQF